MYDNNIPSGGNSVVECLLAKEDVASSSLVSRSILIKEIGSPIKGTFFIANLSTTRQNSRHRKADAFRRSLYLLLIKSTNIFLTLRKT